MKKLCGHCIGGPWKGKYVESYRPYIRVIQKPRSKTTRYEILGSEMSKTTTIKVGTYNWNSQSGKWIWDESY